MGVRAEWKEEGKWEEEGRGKEEGMEEGKWEEEGRGEEEGMEDGGGSSMAELKDDLEKSRKENEVSTASELPVFRYPCTTYLPPSLSN